MDKLVYLYSLGCDKNTVDGEVLLGNILKYDYKLTENIEEADLIIVNTCSFIESAKIESIQAIFESISSKKNENTKIIVTGCLSERYKEDLIKEIPEIDGFFKLNQTDEILELLNLDKIFDQNSRYLSNNTTAYLKIADGCNRNCSYCAIPIIRGKHKSKTIEDLRTELDNLEKNGIKELILVSQDLTQYGSDDKNLPNFDELLEIIARDYNFNWIRLLYLYPEGINQNLIDTINRYSNIIPYFDIPIQHTNNKILKEMGRFITKNKIKDKIKEIRDKIPNSVIRSTVIVGFPGESEAEFEELLEDLKDLQFDRLGAFSYSKEEGTKAYDMEDQIDEEVKENRKYKVNELQSKIMKQKNANFHGKTLDFLVEEKIDSNTYSGRIYSDAPDIDCITYVDTDKELEIGTIVPIKIVHSLDFDFIGDLDESTK